jgi:hypothetical protein
MRVLVQARTIAIRWESPYLHHGVVARVQVLVPHLLLLEESMLSEFPTSACLVLDLYWKQGCWVLVLTIWSSGPALQLNSFGLIDTK